MVNATSYIQRKLFKIIDHTDFVFSLPSLCRESWDSIVSNHSTREQLEYIGDSFMSAAVSEHLWHVLPEGTPFQYTTVRSALTANATFARIMDRLGFSSPRLNVKAHGDAFEAIIGAKKKEDPALLDKWFRDDFMQLLLYAADVCRSLPHKGKPARSRPLLASIRLRSIDYNSPARKRRPASSPASSKIKKTRHSLNYPSMRAPPCMIDLTVDSDVEDGDKDIVQITFEEFNKSQVHLVLKCCLF
ncbi:hypothetical protein BDP27DRAFT_1314058 [Rhodocollybia butyracea]|uniref:RNase III domain-containing protein n=1 Tax=Rhodocollybia butyracea TaxID=206335 RepID=A0A9P5UFC7_9AGAR|nr:hypothetical protein BDP27DRAFT_1314058 [Rhodocollybia butyracea]